MAYATHRRSSPSFSLPNNQPALIDSVDPRTRITIGLVFSLAIAACEGLPTLIAACLLAVAVVPFTGWQPLSVFRRLIPVNLFSLVLVVLLPLSAQGSPLLELGPLSYSQQGLLLAATIALRANAIVLWMMVLIGTLDVITLGHALRHLGIPEKLAHLLLFSVRYMEVLYGEYLRLRTAMKMRAFRPRVNLHTYRSYGHLVGMLLVRSLDRSERILAAMKCRGFRGRFYLWDHFAFSVRDVWCLSIAAILLAALACLEYSCVIH